MSPNSLFHPFHHQNAPFFLLKIENYFKIEYKKKELKLKKMHFYNKMFESH
jgi:hypothetical protein